MKIQALLFSCLIGISSPLLAQSGGGSGGGGQGGAGAGGDQDDLSVVVPPIGQDTSQMVIKELPIAVDKAVLQFKTKIGTVTFLHQMHAALKITRCSTCHHKLQETDTVVKPCHECHKKKPVEQEPPKAMKVFHKRCAGCHEYTISGGSRAGPLLKKCKLCHIKPAKK